MLDVQLLSGKHRDAGCPITVRYLHFHPRSLRSIVPAGWKRGFRSSVVAAERQSSTIALWSNGCWVGEPFRAFTMLPAAAPLKANRNDAADVLRIRGPIEKNR